MSTPAPGDPDPPGPGGGGPPPPRSRRNLIVTVVLIVLIAGLGVFFYARKHSAASAPATFPVGSCVLVKGTSMTHPDNAQAPCTDPAAQFFVTETGDNTLECDPNELTLQKGTTGEDPSVFLCLRPNLATADCWNEGATTSDVPHRVACTAATADTLKVLAVVTTSADHAHCPAATESYLAVGKRRMVYCFTAAK